ncbi:MAG: DUF3455 domain-containing protein [Polaromonas sp.]|uniref:DUF3455 domain-containing protein n=1 Tax=Polaromonas sp. TaxID=1869339 RepID=UPI002730812F|nr:DUF3455 domain-containing protein [Polaromonas sp.]MDP2450807.1 DUF3455 domain-containing protein [Polaromonas sp.]MDP3246157.1 DUF3455 domain-containing protein [Polaromonas sp.]MDP3757782.1 DUF3455 domain-containing protein [Polaromonas sp.]MDP3827891.1 DUF3455 domain-containing protein [Polaromonas sp.]
MKTLSRSNFSVSRLSRSLCLFVLVGSAALLGACGYRPLQPYNTQHDLPEAVRVPEGHQAVLEATSNGRLLYECQAVKRAPYEYEWLLRNASVDLTDTYGGAIMHKPGARASWVHRDGSSVMAREFSEVPNGSSNLPLQRYNAHSSGVPGALHNITYVQRLRTVGGWVSTTPCTSAQLGMRKTIPYEADYIFWRARGS